MVIKMVFKHVEGLNKRRLAYLAGQIAKAGVSKEPLKRVSVYATVVYGDVHDITFSDGSRSSRILLNLQPWLGFT